MRARPDHSGRGFATAAEMPRTISGPRTDHRRASFATRVGGTAAAPPAFSGQSGATSVRRRATASRTERAMARFLVVLGILLVLVGLLWPWLTRLGLGRLPGDIVVQNGNFTFYFPIVSCIILSVVLSLVLWLINR